MRIVGLGLLWVGAALSLLSAIGVVRLPDLFARMHAATKSASLGLACLLVGTAILAPAPMAVVKVVAAILFQFFTAPIAAHMIGRAAYRAGLPLWEGTVVDELARRGLRDRGGPAAP